MKRYTHWMLALIAATSLGLAACDRGDDSTPADDTDAETPMAESMRDMEGMEGADGMEGMEGMRGAAGDTHDGMDMQRHAREADSVATAMRSHLEAMRAASAEQRYDRMEAHVRQVSGMLALMDRHVREMAMGMRMGNPDARMGDMMGMDTEEFRHMIEEMGALQTEIEELQTASREAVRQRMSDHLDRVDRFVAMLEEGATHMRSM